MANEWLRYANRGATRNMPLNQDLAEKLSFLRDLGVTAEVFSGGQPGIGSGGARVGSVRHDHGNSGDMLFHQNGRRLDWANPNDLPLFQDIVRRGKAAGITGWGAGPGYMQPGSMHVGLGSPGVWGAGGRGANAPDWLREAYGDAATGQPKAMPAAAGGPAQPMSLAQSFSDPALTQTPMAPAQPNLSSIAQMFVVDEQAKQRQALEAQAEKTRRAALFGGPSPFG